MKFLQKKGLSLIEMLVVLIVIGVLAGIGIPSLLMSYQKAKEKQNLALLRNLALAIGIYRAEEEMIPYVQTYTELFDILKEGQADIARIPSTDSWGFEFYYYAPTRSSYTLKSFGRDGSESTPAQRGGYFDPNDDLIVINGSFVATRD